MPAVPEDAKLTLRPFRRTDLPTAYALDQVCFAEGIAYSRSELRYFVSLPTAYGVVAEIAGPANNHFAGFLLASHPILKTRGLAHIITLDIDPGFRRLGVASMLMEDAERHYVALGKEGLQLEVAVDNEAAQKFYLKHGFVPTGLLRGYYEGRLDAIRMRKVWTP